MNLKELADRLEVLDEDAFVSLLQLEYTHDGDTNILRRCSRLGAIAGIRSAGC